MRRISLKKKILTILMIVCGACIFSYVAVATLMVETKVTPKEKAVFAFFRAANTPVDYDFWIKTNKSFQAFSEKEQREIFLREQMRLGRGYGHYDVEKEPLKITVDIVAKYVPPEDDNPARIEFRLFSVRGDSIPTFNYPFGDGIISLIINKLDRFKSLELSEAENEAVLSKLPYTDDEFDAHLEVEVRVTGADYEKPVETNGKFQWIMTGDIAYIKCEVGSYYTAEEVLIWDYLAPWFEETYKERLIPDEAKYPHPYDLFKD